MKRMKMAEHVLTIIYLGINAVNDIRKKQIILWSVPVYTIAGILKLFYEGEGGKRLLVAAGCMILLGGISLVTKGSIGFGDVLLLTSISVMMDSGYFSVVVGMGFLLAFIFSGVCLITQRVKRNTEIPFVPFLFLGYVGGLLL